MASLGANMSDVQAKDSVRSLRRLTMLDVDEPSIVGTPTSPSANRTPVARPQTAKRSYLPEDWSDPKRIGAMFCEFRPKEANPEGWDSKLKYWTNNINRWSSATNRVELTVDEVRDAFEKDGVRPQISCIRLVLSEMLRKNMLQTKDEFEANCSQKQASGWIGWGFNSIKKPLSWGLSFVAAVDESECEQIDPRVREEATFVNVQYLNEMSQTLFKELTKSDVASYYRYDALVSLVKEKMDIDSKVLDKFLLLLESEKKAVVTIDTGIKIVKLGSSPSFSELEIGLVRLESAKELIGTEIKKCELQMEAFREEAKQCLKENNKTRAMFLLKRKKRVENQISKKEVQLDNVEYLLEQLLESDSHKLVFDAYQKGADALKAAQLRTDDVTKTMDDFEDALQAQNDLVTGLGKVFRASELEDEDDEDLENELEALLEEEGDELVLPLPVKGTPEKRPAPDHELQELMDRLERLKAKSPGEAPELPPRSKDKPLPAV